MNFSKQGGTEQTFTVNLVKMIIKFQGPYQYSPKKLVKSNMQDITLMKCPTTHKKGCFSEKMTYFPFCSYTSTRQSSIFGHSLRIKFMFLEYAGLGQSCVKYLSNLL